MTEKLGSAPIESEYHEMMNRIAIALDLTLNEKGKKKKTGFILMVFAFDDVGRCNYIPNAKRADVVTMPKEHIKYFEGQPENLSGRA